MVATTIIEEENKSGTGKGRTKSKERAKSNDRFRSKERTRSRERRASTPNPISEMIVEENKSDP